MTAMVQSRVQTCLVDGGATLEWEHAIPDVGKARPQGGSSCRNEREQAGTIQKVSFKARRTGRKVSVMQATDKDLKSGTTLARTLELSSFMKWDSLQVRSAKESGGRRPDAGCRMPAQLR